MFFTYRNNSLGSFPHFFCPPLWIQDYRTPMATLYQGHFLPSGPFWALWAPSEHFRGPTERAGLRVFCPLCPPLPLLPALATINLISEHRQGKRRLRQTDLLRSNCTKRFWVRKTFVKRWQINAKQARLAVCRKLVGKFYSTVFNKAWSGVDSLFLIFSIFFCLRFYWQAIPLMMVSVCRVK